MRLLSPCTSTNKSINSPIQITNKMNTNQTISSKTTGRETAIQLLEAQLKSGIRPISKGPKPYKHKLYGNPVWSYDKDAVEHTKSGIPVRLQALPLTQVEKTRIQNQIVNLQMKIDRQKPNANTIAGGQKILMQIAEANGREKKQSIVKSGNPMRPKNPVTRLYKQIQGVYQRITV